MIRNEILNIYVLKSLESFSNKYLINDDKMKMINVNEKISKINACREIARDLQSKRQCN